MKHSDKKMEKSVGKEIYSLIGELYPICRSITGDGVRETLRILQRHIPIEMFEVPTGTKVFDWTVPNEWNIQDAWIKGPDGTKIIDFKECNLHVLNYSTPVHKKISLEDLKEHLFTLPGQPGLIPYRTSYYNENWGFCMRHSTFEMLAEGEYEVLVDSTLTHGSLTYGEFYSGGEVEEEILISCHVCHPSLCNDNLSGIAVATQLAESIMNRDHHYSYRFLFIPGTIGSITWLAQNEGKISIIRHGIVLSCVGDSGHIHWKKTRREDSEIDRAVENVLQESGDNFEILSFSPYGYDERQFSSPGINLDVGCLMRTPWGQFPEYHTSGDDLDFVNPDSLEDSFNKVTAILKVLDQNRVYINQSPKCEPQLGKRGLYSKISGDSGGKSLQMAILWVLNQSDGAESLLDISNRSGIDFNTIKKAADLLTEGDLLRTLV